MSFFRRRLHGPAYNGILFRDNKVLLKIIEFSDGRDIISQDLINIIFFRRAYRMRICIIHFDLASIFFSNSNLVLHLIVLFETRDHIFEYKSTYYAYLKYTIIEMHNY